MPRFQVLRKLLLGTFIGFVIIFALRRLQDPFPPFGFGGLQSPVCRIRPDWEDSSASQLLYGTVEASKSPVVGDAAFIGNPDRCIFAGPRLNQYQSSQDRNWSDVRWGEVQQRCTRGRYKPTTEFLTEDMWHQAPKEMELETKPGKPGRTAIVLRTWDDYNYSDTRRAWLRALITETALHSGGDYEVFLLVNVKNNDIRLDQDRNEYEQALREFVPEEFRDIAFLYNTRVLESWYPKVEEHGAQDQMYQALQIFSHKFLHLTHIWQLEMDLRLTSHVHTTLESAVAFARAQPRRNLWERNGRFYIPELYNGSYEAFAAAVDADIGDTGVWGPVPTKDFEPYGPQPPSRSTVDWGVNEDADLISLMPMIDPVGTDWIYEDRVYGFADGAATPRRAAFVSMTRASGRLLRLVSQAQRERGQWVVSEATLETFALLHGLKAVTVPHPIAFDDSVTAEAADADINHGPPHSKAGGKAPSMSYTTGGFILGPWFHASYWFAADAAPNYWQQYLDGRCMPPMLLHPVKDE